MQTFFTADTHFGHKNIINYCERPFSSVEEMDQTLITNWNMVVSECDVVYHLGDFVFGCPERIRKRLNGRIFLILGNHDKFGKKWHSLFEGVFQIHEYKNIIMCHYPIRYWNRSHYNSWHSWFRKPS